MLTKKGEFNNLIKKIMKIIKLLFFILFISNVQAQCWSKISAGEYYSVGIKNDGTLWAWGRPIGGNNLSGTMPITQIGTDNNWQKISAGNNHVLAIKNNGTLWSWGSNSSGQLGDNTTITKYSPIQIGTSNNWLEISAGGFHSIGIKNDGTLWFWGNKEDGTNIDFLTPTQTGIDTDWIKVSAGEYDSFALKNNGTLWFLGNQNPFQQLGNLSNWIDFSSGGNYRYGIRNDGTLWQLNITSTTGPNLETQVWGYTQIGSDNNWQSVSAGTNYLILKKANNTIWAKGTNTYGQLGTGNNVNVNVLPIQIGTSGNWSLLSTGRFHTLMLNNSGNVFATGYNGSGALGDGTLIDKNVPTLLNCPTLSVEQFETNLFTIYPNPSNNIINLKNNTNAIIENIKINDLTGKIVFSSKNNLSEISIQNFETGIYILSIKSENKIYNYKLVKN